MEKLLTIIVPTYNMERYLQKCLNSIVLKDMELLSALEVIVVNDGSMDSSSQIAHSFENKYPNVFHVIDKENGNYGSCINAALPVASGKYVKILDADDYFDNEQFSKYLEKLKNIDVDLVVNDKRTVDSIGVVLNTMNVDVKPLDILCFGDIVKSAKVYDMHKLAYKRTMLLDMNYRQTEGVSYTDSEWAIFPLSMIRTAYYLPYPVYFYLQGREGQTVDKSVRSKALKSLKTVQFSLGDFVMNYHGPADRKQYIFDIFIRDTLSLYEEFIIGGYYSDAEFRALDAELMSSYPEIQSSIDNHKWVSFIPNLQLVKDWRENKTVKFAIEIAIIKAYLFVAEFKNGKKQAK